MSNKFINNIVSGIKNSKLMSKLVSKVSGKGEEQKNRSLDDFEWEQFLLQVFSPSIRGAIHKFFMVALILVCAYATGKTIALLTRPQTKEIKKPKTTLAPTIQRANYKNKIDQIKRANLFNIAESDKDRKKSEEARKKAQAKKFVICKSAKKASSLPYKLMNTIVLQNSSKSIASFNVSGEKEPLNLREGDKIKNKAEISKIERQKIIIKNLNTNNCEYIQNLDDKFNRKFSKSKLKVHDPVAGKKLIGKKYQGIKNVGNNFVIKKSLRNDMMKNISEVLTQARAITMKNPDGSLSFKMTEVAPGSIYSKLNIQNDDIITGIDGKKIQSLNEIMKKFGNIKNIDTLQISVKRGGIEQNLDYEFE